MLNFYDFLLIVYEIMILVYVIIIYIYAVYIYIYYFFCIDKYVQSEDVFYISHIYFYLLVYLTGTMQYNIAAISYIYISPKNINIYIYIYIYIYIFFFDKYVQSDYVFYISHIYFHLLVYLTGTMQYNIATISSSQCSTYRLLAKG